jgi:hypothetical protein
MCTSTLAWRVSLASTPATIRSTLARSVWMMIGGLEQRRHVARRQQRRQAHRRKRST